MADISCENFIKEIAPMILAECVARGYMYPSAIIAQACLESNYGRSKLSSVYHNYFGIKAGKAWTGRRVNFKTMEEYTTGTLTQINDDFRAYDSMHLGIIGYFDFLEKNSRYANLKSATSAHDYLERIKADGYATSSKYASNVESLRVLMGLEKYDYGGELVAAVDTLASYIKRGVFNNAEQRRDNLYLLCQVWINRGK